jgi:hypothetical protein
MTDEEDGRPGSVAPQFGHLDALTDVPTVPLRLARPLKNSFCLLKTRSELLSLPALAAERRKAGPSTPLRFARDDSKHGARRLCAARVHKAYPYRLTLPQVAGRLACQGGQIRNTKEKHHENVPGK